MRLCNRGLSIFVALALACPQVLAEPNINTLDAMDTKVTQFVNDFQKTPYVLLLMDDQLKELLKDYNINRVLEAQADKIDRVTNGPSQSLEALPWMEEKAKFERQAYAFAKETFSLSIEEVNLTLLSIFHRYLMEENSRTALSYILKAVKDYKFSPAELEHLKIEASPWHQASVGSEWAVGIGGALLVVAAGRQKSTWEKLGGYFSNLSKRTMEKFTAKEVKTIAEDDASPEALWDLIQHSGLASAEGHAVTGAVKLSSGKVVGKVSFFRHFAAVTNLFNAEGRRWFGIVLGVSTAGAATNVGIHALANEIPETLSNTNINYNDLRDNYYDGLAALRLSCRSHEWLQRVMALQQLPETLHDTAVGMNNLFTEYSLLRNLNHTLVSTTQLPSPDVQWDAASGEVKFNRQELGHTVTEHFACPKLKDQPTGPVRVNLLETEEDIRAAAAHISELAETKKKAEADTKARDQANAAKAKEKPLTTGEKVIQTPPDMLILGPPPAALQVPTDEEKR